MGFLGDPCRIWGSLWGLWALVAALCFSPVVLLKELCKALGSIWKKRNLNSCEVFKYFYKEVFNSR